MQHPPISRPVSSPFESPPIPNFTNERPATVFDDHSMRKSTDSHPISLRKSGSVAPSFSASLSVGDLLSRRPRLDNLPTVDALSPPPVRRRAASTYSPVRRAPPIALHIEGNIASLSPSARKPVPVLDGKSPEIELEETTEKSKKLRLNTSTSLLARVRSRSAKSSSALQTPESSRTDPSPMTSKTAPARLSYKGKQRERSKSFVELRSRAPPMPFTATAFTFKELNSDPLVVKPVLTEQEREDRWAALLARSDLAGGTLTATLEGGALLSDTISVAED
jgi:hypothetical protein